MFTLRSNTNHFTTTTIAKMIISVFDIVENLGVKGEKAGFQHIFPLQKCFQKA